MPDIMQDGNRRDLSPTTHTTAWARRPHRQLSVSGGSKTTPPVVSEWIKFPWEKSSESSGDAISMKEAEELRRKMREENAARMEAAKEQK